MSESIADKELRDGYQFDYSQAKPNRFAGVVKKGTSPQRHKPVNDDRGNGTATEDNVQKLRSAATAFAKNREVAEAMVAHYKPVIEQLVKAKMLAGDRAVVGSVLHSEVDDDSRTARYYAAGVRGADGIGAFSYLLGFDQEPDALTTYEFVPYTNCPPLVQAQLAGQIDGLVFLLMKELGVPA